MFASLYDKYIKWNKCLKQLHERERERERVRERKREGEGGREREGERVFITIIQHLRL